MSLFSLLFFVVTSCMMFLCPVVFIIGLFLLIRRSNTRLKAGWDELAMRTGMTHTAPQFLGSGQVAGTFRGRQARVYIYSTGSGKSRQSWTAISVLVANPGKATLSLSPQGMLSGIGKAFGVQDIQIGIEEFDKKYIIQSSSPELALNVLANNSMLRADIVTLNPYGISFQAETAACRVWGFESNVDRLEKLLNLVSDWADAVEKAM